MATDMKDGVFPQDNMPIPNGDRVMPLFSLKGRTAIVSGAGGGIGLAVAHALAEAGANVAIWYNSSKQAEKEAENIEKTYNVKCRAYQVNVTSAEAVDKAINENVKEFNGRLDVFVANSGIAWQDGPFIDGSVEKVKKVMDVNLDGVMWCAKSAGTHFRRQKKEGTTIDGKPLENYSTGNFIATASIGGSIVTIPQLQVVYNCTKAAVIHFCKGMAVEWTGFARCNAVSPGYTKTEILDYCDDSIKKQWMNKTPMGRLGHVNEMKGAYLYLASDASSFTTGLDLIVDGGYVLP